MSPVRSAELTHNYPIIERVTYPINYRVKYRLFVISPFIPSIISYTMRIMLTLLGRMEIWELHMIGVNNGWIMVGL